MSLKRNSNRTEGLLCGDCNIDPSKFMVRKVGMTLAEFKKFRKKSFAALEKSLEEEEMMIGKESKLLRQVYSTTALKLERPKIAALVKIVEFWIKQKFKRGEALELLVNTLDKYRDVRVILEKKEVERSKKEKIVAKKALKRIPELQRGFQLMEKLKNEFMHFTSDDFYKTMEEQFEATWKFYDEFWGDPKYENVGKKYWEEVFKDRKRLEEGGINVGDSIIHFTFVNEKDETIDSKDLLKRGPLVLSFFRGSWCAFCVEELCVLTDSLPKFKALGANLVSLGPDKTSLYYFKKEGVTGFIGIDDDLKIANKYNLVYKIGEATRNMCKPFNLDLVLYNGNDDYLPVPATYIFGVDGRCVFAYKNCKYYQRLEPLKIVECLYSLFEKRERKDSGSFSGVSAFPQVSMKISKKRPRDDSSISLLKEFSRPKKKVKKWELKKFYPDVDY